MIATWWAVTWALMAFYIFQHFYSIYDDWYHKEILIVKHPKLNYLKQLPDKIKAGWLEYVEEVDAM